MTVPKLAPAPAQEIDDAARLDAAREAFLAVAGMVTYWDPSGQGYVLVAPEALDRLGRALYPDWDDEDEDDGWDDGEPWCA